MELSKDDWELTKREAKGQIAQAKLTVAISEILVEGCNRKLTELKEKKILDYIKIKDVKE